MQRVQSAHTNKENKMVKILTGIDDNDNGTTRVPGQRKQQIENVPEHYSMVPDVEPNPMAATTKWLNKNNVQPLSTPSVLPLQPAHPLQVPPKPCQSVAQQSVSNSVPQHLP